MFTASPSFEPEARLADSKREGNLDPIIDEFQNKFSPKVEPPVANVCDSLELGEAPSRDMKEKAPLISSGPLTPTKDFEAQYDSTRVREPDPFTLLSLQNETTSRVELSVPLSSRRLSFSREANVKLMEAIQEDIAHLLNLPNPHLLKDHVTLVSAPSGTVLSEECEMPREIYFVVSGEIHAIQSSNSLGSPIEVSVFIHCCCPCSHRFWSTFESVVFNV